MVALDIGGTKLAAGLVSLDGRVLRRDEVPTDGADAEALFTRVGGLLDETLRAAADSGHHPVVCGLRRADDARW